MATVTFAYDHSRDPMSPAQLADQIQSSLSLAAAPRVDINQTQIVVAGAGVTSANTASIQALINSYVFDPTWSGGAATALAAKAQNALNANATFLALASPTNAQTLAQVQLLTKECNALIRLALGLLDSTAGT